MSYRPFMPDKERPRRKGMRKNCYARGWALFGMAIGLAGTVPGIAADLLTVTGAGATFPYPLYSKWFYEYSNSHPGVNFNYPSIGSGGGIRQVTAGTVDFGATDAPMTGEGMAKLPGPILHIPAAI